MLFSQLLRRWSWQYWLSIAHSIPLSTFLSPSFDTVNVVLFISLCPHHSIFHSWYSEGLVINTKTPIHTNYSTNSTKRTVTVECQEYVCPAKFKLYSNIIQIFFSNCLKENIQCVLQQLLTHLWIQIQDYFMLSLNSEHQWQSHSVSSRGLGAILGV